MFIFAIILQDALSKTIPIWAAVLNQAAKFRFVKKLSQQQQQQQQQYSGLHIPPWIPRNESNEINKQMQTWVESFLALGLDLKNLEPLLQRPLRCVWISQDDDEWTKHSLNNGSNLYDGFTPIILINASLPNHRQRRRLRVARMNVDVMYDYIPGAGDDEETWANGLTPPVLWAHLDEILQGGPRNANAIAARMKRQHSNGEKKCDICLNAYCGHTTSCLAMEYHSVPDHSVNSWTLQWIGDPVGLGIANIRQATDDTDTENPHELTNSGGVHFSGDDRIVDKHAVVWLVDKETEESLGQSTASAVTHFVMRSNSRTHLGKDKYFPEQLRGCIDFVSKHLAAGENILVKTDRQGFSVAGAILLACMIACYEINHEDGDGDDYGDDDRDGDVRRTLRWSGPFKQSVEGNGLSLLPASCLAVGNLTRKLMKKYLANITARYPQLIVSKGLLRQVFNIFAVGNQVK